jgi:hypothetical protein
VTNNNGFWFWRLDLLALLYYYSHTFELLLNVCMTNLYCTNEFPFITDTRPEYHIEQLTVLCYSVCFYGNVFVNIRCLETGVCVLLPSKLSSTSAVIPTFRPCLPSRCLGMDYSVTMCTMCLTLKKSAFRPHMCLCVSYET